ncbi:MAG: hypothetical protein ABW217_03520 [Polyangiaceae bacterium]
MTFDASSLLAGLLVSSIGFVLFTYGKRMGRPPQLATGLVLMIFPYFVSSVPWMLGLATVLLGLFWLAMRLGY